MELTRDRLQRAINNSAKISFIDASDAAESDRSIRYSFTVAQSKAIFETALESTYE